MAFHLFSNSNCSNSSSASNNRRKKVLVALVALVTSKPSTINLRHWPIAWQLTMKPMRSRGQRPQPSASKWSFSVREPLVFGYPYKNTYLYIFCVRHLFLGIINKFEGTKLTIIINDSSPQRYPGVWQWFRLYKLKPFGWIPANTNKDMAQFFWPQWKNHFPLDYDTVIRATAIWTHYYHKCLLFQTYHSTLVIHLQMFWRSSSSVYQIVMVN